MDVFTNNSLTNDLLSFLSIEKSAYSEMLSLSLAKKDMMIKDDLAGINNTTAKENKLYNRIKNLEDRRVEETEKIAKEVGMKPEEITLDFLIGNLPKQDSDRLSKIKTDLVSILDKLNRSNEINKVLIAAQLDYIEFCRELMIERDNIGNNYDNCGYVDKSARAGVIDQTV